MRPLAAIALMAVTLQSAWATPHPDDSGTIAVTPVSISIDANAVLLQWDAVPTYHPVTGSPFSRYLILGGSHPDSLKRIASTSKLQFRLSSANLQSHAFYRVVADYSTRTLRSTSPLPRRDDTMLLNFDEGDLDLQSWGEDEDFDPDAWELTDAETLPDSGRSLRLFGNTYKTLHVDPITLTDNTVWSLGILSLDGDTLANLQAFGLGDGDQRLFYTFHGLRTIWEQPWVIANQDMRPREEWETFLMAVGYDWNIRYGYLPEITELFFINDNDSNETASQLYFDELTDVTESVPPQPSVGIIWNINGGDFNSQVIGLGGPVWFNPRVSNVGGQDLTYRWDFGDGAFSDIAEPTHYYPGEGVYSVALTVGTPDNRIGQARSLVDLGEYRFERSLSACFAGDVMLARRYEDPGGVIEQRGPEAVFERIRDVTTAADMCFVNLECPLTDEGSPHPTKGITFRGRPENVAGLTSAGIDVVSQSNNHVHDYGRRGMEETIEVLDAASIGHSGAGMDEYQSLQPVFRTVNGVRIGMLAFCNRTGRDANERPYGDAGYDKFGFAYFSGDNIARSVPDADELCDVLVIYVHGGSEYALAPGRDNEFASVSAEEIDAGLFASPGRDSATIELEHLAIDLGADLVIGAHPHVLQGFEVYNGVFIAHSLGNFAFDQNFFETWPSALVWADITDGVVTGVRVEPLFVDNYYPTPATGALGRKILDRLAGYSTPLATTVIPDYDRMQVSVALDEERVQRAEEEFNLTAAMRYIDADSVYRSEPIRLDGGGFPSVVVSIAADAENPEYRVRLGREILLVGNMEDEGAAIWNYNSNFERVDDQVAFEGVRSSYIERPQDLQDVVTDLIQRIPVYQDDALTLSGWLHTENARDAGLSVRYYRYRYDALPQNITGTQLIERRLQGDNDWTHLWGELEVPANTAFLNVRWQLFGPDAGTGKLWIDDVDLIRWEAAQQFEGDLEIAVPSDLYYLQVETTSELAEVGVTYRTVTLAY